MRILERVRQRLAKPSAPQKSTSESSQQIPVVDVMQFDTSIINTNPWFEGKQFSHDWTSNKLALWLPVLAEFSDQEADVLEVGTYEGRSAIAFLESMPRSKVSCIDHFRQKGVEERFDANMVAYTDRVRKLKGRAIPHMSRLLDAGEKFDVIYLDAAKDRAGAFILSSMAWTLLKVGGIIIWDDLTWGPEKPAEERPEPGSRLFMATFSSCLQLIHDKSIRPGWNQQAIARKTMDWPAS